MTHHLIPRELKSSKLIKQLGIDIEEQANKILAHQKGFTQAHRSYNKEFKDLAADLERRIASNEITVSEARQIMEQLRSARRADIERNPKALLGKKSEPSERGGSTPPADGANNLGSGKRDDWP